MALKITLKPGEKFVLNGAVVQNGDRRTNLIIHNRVSILREKDILLPENAVTPVRRIYFAVQMMYLDETVEKVYHEEFIHRITEFINIINDQDILSQCVSIIEDVHKRAYYSALLTCKKLLPYEQERLEYDLSNLVAQAQGATLHGDGAGIISAGIIETDEEEEEE